MARVDRAARVAKGQRGGNRCPRSAAHTYRSCVPEDCGEARGPVHTRCLTLSYWAAGSSVVEASFAAPFAPLGR
jgi:hypothetical protein